MKQQFEGYTSTWIVPWAVSSELRAQLITFDEISLLSHLKPSTLISKFSYKRDVTCNENSQFYQENLLAFTVIVHFS